MGDILCWREMYPSVLAQFHQKQRKEFSPLEHCLSWWTKHLKYVKISSSLYFLRNLCYSKLYLAYIDVKKDVLKHVLYCYLTYTSLSRKKKNKTKLNTASLVENIESSIVALRNYHETIIRIVFQNRKHYWVLFFKTKSIQYYLFQYIKNNSN